MNLRIPVTTSLISLVVSPPEAEVSTDQLHVSFSLAFAVKVLSATNDLGSRFQIWSQRYDWSTNRQYPESNLEHCTWAPELLACKLLGTLSSQSLTFEP